MTSNNTSRRNLYTSRSSYYYQAKHFNDVFINLGFNYRGKLLSKGTSPELWANSEQIGLINTLESMLNSILEHAKYVKKWFSIAHDKNTTNIV